MDRRRIDLQIRTILVTYRGERRRADSTVMREFRSRAAALLAELEDAIEPYPDLRPRIAATLREIQDGDG